MDEQKEVVLVENINALELFTQDGLDPLLAEIEKKATDFTPDTETAKGRTEIASMAHKVSKAKVVIESAGKGLVADWKNRAKVVDQSRRASRKFLDRLRDRVRLPLTEWESEESRKKEEIRKAFELERMMKEALAEDEIFERELELREREAKLEAEAEQRRKEEQAKLEAEQKEKEDARIRAEAAAKAKLEAEELIKAEREKTERAEQEAKEEKERAEAAAEQAEKDKIAAQERAEREQKEAIERERQQGIDRAAAEERARVQQAEEQKREDESRAADREHRRKINAAILKHLTAEGIAEKEAKKVITLVASGAVPAMHIRY